MFLITSLLFGALLAANGCPLDLINCTIPYDDLNISSVVIIDATQYCHVDNCTVKIIKTGDELNIAYHNDQYHLGCTTTTLQLLEINDKLCEETKTNTILHVLDSILSICTLIIHIILIMAIIIKLKRCSSLPFCLLLAAFVTWAIFCALATIHSFMRYIFKVPNAICITTLFVAVTIGHCAMVIEFELFLAMLYAFYQCYKLRPLLSEETTKKFFWRCITVAVCVVVVINSSRVVVAFQDATYLTDEGYCIAVGDISKVTPFTLYISTGLLFFLLSAEIVVFIFTGFLLFSLSRNHGFTETTNSYKYMKSMVKILIILLSSSIIFMLVYFIAAMFAPNYDYTIGIFAMICERCVILLTLMKCGKIKSCGGCSAMHSDMTTLQ